MNSTWGATLNCKESILRKKFPLRTQIAAFTSKFSIQLFLKKKLLPAYCTHFPTHLKSDFRVIQWQIITWITLSKLVPMSDKINTRSYLELHLNQDNRILFTRLLSKSTADSSRTVYLGQCHYSINSHFFQTCAQISRCTFHTENLDLGNRFWRP